ncbi:MAG TPA: hypothetical protein VK611_28000 [Acidimicrobiales bacterium]|nr:hypothetical protein [Acidimicrobiales bacterium]
MDDLQTLLRPLIERPETPPLPIDWIADQAQRRTHRRRALTVATVAVALAAVGVPAWLVAQPAAPGADTRTAAPSATEPPSSATPPTSATSAPPPADPFGPTPPWAAAPLPASAAPAYVEAADSDPDAAAKCPVVAPSDLGEGAGATPRMTTRGQPGRWGVEYDLAGAPGTPDDGALATPDAGRNTFTVYAIVMPPVPPGMGESMGLESVRDLVTQRPVVHTWSDGSVAGWGGDLPGTPQPDTSIVVDGEVVPIPDLTPGPPAEPEPEDMVVQFQLQGADPSCLYAVHSYLGEAHTFHLVEHLRRLASP